MQFPESVGQVQGDGQLVITSEHDGGHLKVGPLAGFCADDGFRVCAELNAELMRPVGAVAAAGCKWEMLREGRVPLV